MEEQQDFKELLELFTLNKMVISRKKILEKNNETLNCLTPQWSVLHGAKKHS